MSLLSFLCTYNSQGSTTERKGFPSGSSFKSSKETRVRSKQPQGKIFSCIHQNPTQRITLLK